MLNKVQQNWLGSKAKASVILQNDFSRNIFKYYKVSYIYYLQIFKKVYEKGLKPKNFVIIWKVLYRVLQVHLTFMSPVMLLYFYVLLHIIYENTHFSYITCSRYNTSFTFYRCIIWKSFWKCKYIVMPLILWIYSETLECFPLES